jgi:adenosylcobinamide kinase/adenosylcobinamide-phosphate guanylyltransferase
MGEIILYLGGAKSGKTRAALDKTETYAPPRYYLATALAQDAEMAVKIKNHQAERGPDWRTIEEPLDLPLGMKKAGPDSPVLLDCLTLWLSNQISLDPEYRSFDRILAKVELLLEAASKRSGPVIMVSNEVGNGLVPMESISRFFRDISGLTHQRIAQEATSVFLVTAGLPLKLK